MAIVSPLGSNLEQLDWIENLNKIGTESWLSDSNEEMFVGQSLSPTLKVDSKIEDGVEVV